MTPHGYLDALYGIQNDQPQFSIKDVEIQYIAESGSLTKGVSAVVLLERKPIGSKSVIVQVLKVETG